MTSRLLPEDISRISRFVKDHIGFSYAPDREHDLTRGFLAACQDLGVGDPVSCMNMMDDPRSFP